MHRPSQAIFASAMAVTLMCAAPVNAQQAQTPHPFKSASISWNPNGGVTPQFRIAHDGTRYTHLEGNLETRFQLNAEIKSGHRVAGFVLATVDPTNLTQSVADVIRDAMRVRIGAEVNLGEGMRTIDRNVLFSLDARQAFNGVLPIDQKMIDMCNSEFPELPSEEKVVTTAGITVFAGFSHQKWNSLQQAGFNGWDVNRGRPAIAFTTIDVKVICNGKPAARAAELPPERAKAKPISVDLRVKQHGKTCPKQVTVTAYADYKSATTATMRMARMGNRPGKIKKVKTSKVEAFGKVWYRAEAEFKYVMDPGEKTFKLWVDGTADVAQTVIIDCPPFKVTSAWLKYDVEETDACPKEIVETATFNTTRPGWVDYIIKHETGLPAWQDRLTAKRSGNGYSATHVRKFTIGEFNSRFMADVKNRPANSGWVRLKVDCMKVSGGDITFTDANGPSCPRKATALISMQTGLEGQVPYRLRCSGGRNWHRTATAQNMQNGHIVALDVLPLTIAKTEEISCQLHSLVNGQPRLLKQKSHRYRCVTPNVDAGGDKTVPRRDLPRIRPQVTVNVLPEAVLPKTESRKIVPPKIVSPKIAPPRIAPKAATIISKPPKRVKPAAKPVCRGGRLVKASSSPTVFRCLCSQGNPRKVRKGWLCPAKIAPRAAKPLCKGGVIRSGKCVCRANRKLVKGACLANTVGKRIKARTVTKTSPAIRRKALTGKKRVTRRKKNGKVRLPALQPVR